MNVPDEDVSAIQRKLLRSYRVSVRHIGYDTGCKGMTDEEIIPFLLCAAQPSPRLIGISTPLAFAMHNDVRFPTGLERLWREEGSGSPEQVIESQGKVEHIRSDRRSTFDSLDEPLDFLRWQVASMENGPAVHE